MSGDVHVRFCERLGVRFPWATHLVILLRSERAARRVMEGMTDFLEQTLGLPVNRDKSRVAPVKDVEFLGFQILRGTIRISTKARQRFKNRVTESQTGVWPLIEERLTWPV